MTITCATCHRQDTIDPDDLAAIIMGGWYADETGTYCEADQPEADQ